MIRVTTYNAFIHEQTEESVKAVYPDGIYMARAHQAHGPAPMLDHRKPVTAN